MADPPRRPDPDSDETDLPAGSEIPPGTPRWVKVLGIVALAAVLVIVVVVLVGGHTPPIQHGP